MVISRSVQGEIVLIAEAASGHILDEAAIPRDADCFPPLL